MRTYDVLCIRTNVPQSLSENDCINGISLGFAQNYKKINEQINQLTYLVALYGVAREPLSIAVTSPQAASANYR